MIDCLIVCLFVCLPRLFCASSFQGAGRLTMLAFGLAGSLYNVRCRFFESPLAMAGGFWGMPLTMILVWYSLFLLSLKLVENLSGKINLNFNYDELKDFGSIK